MPGHVHLMFVARPNTCSSMALVKTVRHIPKHKIMERAVVQMNAYCETRSSRMVLVKYAQISHYHHLIERHVKLRNVGS